MIPDTQETETGGVAGWGADQLSPGVEVYWTGPGNILRPCLKQKGKTTGEGGTWRGIEGRGGNPTDN